MWVPAKSVGGKRREAEIHHTSRDSSGTAHSNATICQTQTHTASVNFSSWPLQSSSQGSKNSYIHPQPLVHRGHPRRRSGNVLKCKSARTLLPTTNRSRVRCNWQNDYGEDLVRGTTLEPVARTVALLQLTRALESTSLCISEHRGAPSQERRFFGPKADPKTAIDEISGRNSSAAQAATLLFHAGAKGTPGCVVAFLAHAISSRIECGRAVDATAAVTNGMRSRFDRWECLELAGLYFDEWFDDKETFTLQSSTVITWYCVIWNYVVARKTNSSVISS